MAAAVTSLILFPLASQGSGAAVGAEWSDVATAGMAVTESRATAIAESSGSVRPRPKCLSARQALRFYRARMAASLRAMGAPAPRLSWPPARGACDYVRWLVERAQDRAHAARIALERWRHEFAWWRWLPAKWRRIATCETRLDWSWDSGTYVSAFGIYRPGYADDARQAGTPDWPAPGWETRGERPPTPREQFETALSHYRLHGGFSGWGCRGA